MDSDLVDKNVAGKHHLFHDISKDFLSEKSLAQFLLATYEHIFHAYVSIKRIKCT